MFVVSVGSVRIFKILYICILTIVLEIFQKSSRGDKDNIGVNEKHRRSGGTTGYMFREDEEVK
jgi:hypothetical protein